MFGALGRFCYRRRRAVALGWLVFLLAGFLGGGTVFGRLSTSGGSPSAESVRGGRLLTSAAATGAQLIAVVDAAPVQDPAVRASVTAAARDVAAMPDVAGVRDYYGTGVPQLESRDGRASLVLVDLRRGLADDRSDAALDAVRSRLKQVRGATVTVGGDALLVREINDTVENDLRRGEVTGLPLCLVAMVFIFGGIVAAGLPLLAAVSTIAGTLLLLLGFSYLTDLDPNVVSVVTVMGLGLAIDYGLLIVNRFREERSYGLSIEHAVARTSQTAGRTITFSALTVAVSLAGLLVFHDPTFRSFGAGGVGVVLVALAAGLTLVPALLSMWGPRISTPTTPPSDIGFFSRLTRRAQHHRVAVIAVTVLVLLAAGAPFLAARYQNGGANLIPKSFETRQVADTVASRFPGQQADPVLVVTRLAAGDPRLNAYARSLAGRPGVARASVGQPMRGQVSRVEVVPQGTAQGPVAQRLVKDLRADRPAFPTLVTGSAAYLVDFKSSIAHSMPIAIALIMLGTFVLLFLMTGSVLVPLKALVMTVLSLGASFGALVLIFQDGHLSGLLGFSPAGAIETWVPVIAFVFAFGLSMDYEVFLLARIKELYDAGYPNDEAVATGLQRSGRIITSAAFLVVIVFSGFAAGKMIGIKEMGVTLALAVAVDATVVRVLLVPATMSLLGDLNWWAPAPLRRLHQRIGLSETGARPEVGVPRQREPELVAATGTPLPRAGRHRAPRRRILARR